MANHNHAFARRVNVIRFDHRDQAGRALTLTIVRLLDGSWVPSGEASPTLFYRPSTYSALLAKRLRQRFQGRGEPAFLGYTDYAVEVREAGRVLGIYSLDGFGYPLGDVRHAPLPRGEARTMPAVYLDVIRAGWGQQGAVLRQRGVDSGQEAEVLLAAA